MPLYCYRCPQGHEEERLEPMTAPESHPCPECGATQERLEPYDSPKPLCHSCGEAEMERQVSQTGPWKFKEGE